MNILVINESKPLTNVMKTTLSDEGHNVNVITDGISAYDYLTDNTPDLVILDLMISYVTGYEIIEFIREMEHKYVKIILMTQVQLDKVIEDAFELGIDDYMTVPFRKKELIARVHRLSRYTLSV